MLLNIFTKNTQILFITVLLASATVLYFYGRSLWVPVYWKIIGKRTVTDVIDIYGASARKRLLPYFRFAGVTYPPEKIVLLGIKDSGQLEVWAEFESQQKFIRSYPIRALSGKSGPKLREGDKQVPEGLYKVEGLNPNSSYHLSIKLNYPNAFDLKHAALDGRSNPGSNIFIHGKEISIGCLAIGDSAIEELFVLTADIGTSKINVAIAPSDPRLTLLSTHIKPAWISVLYQQLNIYFNRYRHLERELSLEYEEHNNSS